MKFFSSSTTNLINHTERSVLRSIERERERERNREENTEKDKRTYEKYSKIVRKFLPRKYLKSGFQCFHCRVN